ncbi:Stk1 family PASTA domain-containing Ser/Thr kinase [Weissella ceti]|uniref:non-specific serine/threonine protein kinase n=1 Tax=Weissella ceti TaxID=759620 RepID=A0ABT3E2Q5_9LACO|nr:Stk1 family PASTA domain-containing Ser/Thr kinase [Weissella ceti]MCW0952694.1 Stk1 family PASTA domain-containing Ser/Thr kinase [Weissella ceti]QVK12396.1 Stk1 family PASTA domain-containing Ser/Thr kinase [Weissella ceti]
MNAGHLIGDRYRVISRLGKGGMANVYRAYDTILEREVAVKFMRLDLKDDPMVQKRFENEIRSSSELVNEHITQVYDYGEENGSQYLVTEFVDGKDLKRYELTESPIPLTKIVDLMSQILIGVEAAHDQRIIHRDLKPQNILVSNEGEAKITDFGIARAQSSYGMTQTNTAIGSVHYMAPEQVRGETASVRSDIYSLGIMLFELLTGDVPYTGETSVAVAVKHTTESMPSVREQDPRIPQALENVVLKATAKHPADRYASAAKMAEDLATVLSPERVNEAKWVASHTDEDATVTKVLHLSGADHNGQATQMTTTIATQVVPEAVESVATPFVDENNRQPKKSGKRWFIWLTCLLVLVLAGFGFAVASQPQMYTVPDVKNMSVTEAKQTLADSNLDLGDVTQEYSSTLEKDMVIGSTPGSGKKVRKDAKVDLVISRGPEQVRFGDYVNAKYSDVSEDLKRKGYLIDHDYLYSDVYPSGYIISQSIQPDAKVIPADTNVTFVVSSGPMPVAPTLPKADSDSESKESSESKSSKKSESKSESKATKEDDSDDKSDVDTPTETDKPNKKAETNKD